MIYIMIFVTIILLIRLFNLPLRNPEAVLRRVYKTLYRNQAIESANAEKINASDRNYLPSIIWFLENLPLSHIQNCCATLLIELLACYINDPKLDQYLKSCVFVHSVLKGFIALDSSTIDSVE